MEMINRAEVRLTLHSKTDILISATDKHRFVQTILSVIKNNVGYNNHLKGWVISADLETYGKVWKALYNNSGAFDVVGIPSAVLQYLPKTHTSLLESLKKDKHEEQIKKISNTSKQLDWIKNWFQQEVLRGSELWQTCLSPIDRYAVKRSVEICKGKVILSGGKKTAKVFQSLALASIYQDYWPMLILCNSNECDIWKKNIQYYLNINEQNICIINNIYNSDSTRNGDDGDENNDSNDSNNDSNSEDNYNDYTSNNSDDNDDDNNNHENNSQNNIHNSDMQSENNNSENNYPFSQQHKFQPSIISISPNYLCINLDNTSIRNKKKQPVSKINRLKKSNTNQKSLPLNDNLYISLKNDSGDIYPKGKYFPESNKNRFTYSNQTDSEGDDDDDGVDNGYLDDSDSSDFNNDVDNISNENNKNDDDDDDDIGGENDDYNNYTSYYKRTSKHKENQVNNKISEADLMSQQKGIQKVLSFNKTKVFIVSYEVVKHFFKIIYAKRFNFLIFDDCDQIKYTLLQNYKTTLKRYIKNANSAVMINNLPIYSKPIEVYPMLQLLRPDLFLDFKFFGKRYCNGKNGVFGWDYTGASNTSELEYFLENSVVVSTDNYTKYLDSTDGVYNDDEFSD
ncbi:unnamed protein product [Cunninghamella blakesleeana]